MAALPGFTFGVNPSSRSQRRCQRRSGGRAVFLHDLPVKRGGRKEESRTESDLPGSELALTYVPPLRKRGYLFQAKVLDGLCVQTYRFSYKLLSFGDTRCTSQLRLAHRGHL